MGNVPDMSRMVTTQFISTAVLIWFQRKMRQRDYYFPLQIVGLSSCNIEDIVKIWVFQTDIYFHDIPFYRTFHLSATLNPHIWSYNRLNHNNPTTSVITDNTKIYAWHQCFLNQSINSQTKGLWPMSKMIRDCQNVWSFSQMMSNLFRHLPTQLDSILFANKLGKTHI